MIKNLFKRLFKKEKCFNGCRRDYQGRYRVPNGVTYIGRPAFAGCKWVTSVEIPNSVKSIWGHAFEGCTALVDIEIPNSVTEIDRFTFKDCKALRHIDIPNSVKGIGVAAFWGCSGLTELDLPASIQCIGPNAFKFCQIKHLHIRSEHPEKIAVAGDPFDGWEKECTLHVPVGTGYAYRHHPVFGKFREIVIERSF